jgi:hypothetical protein
VKSHGKKSTCFRCEHERARLGKKS